MPRTLRELTAHPATYPVVLAVGIGLFLLVVGLNADALPFPRGAAYSDAATSHWPNALFLQRSIRSGNFPWWRPLIMSGQPFAANPLNKVWYPPQWLAVILPATLHLNALLWLHLVWAGLGMRAFAVQLGLSAGSAALIGAAYALTPRLIAAAGAGHLDILYAAAWFPWVMWATRRALQPGKRWLVSAALLGGCVSLCLLADLRLSVFVFGTAAAYAIFEGIARKRWQPRTPLIFGLALVLALALSAVQWIPLVALLPSLSRAGMTVNDAGVFSLAPAGLIGLVVADWGGEHETFVYIGIGLLILALVGLVARRRIADSSRSARFSSVFWIGAVIVAGLYALGEKGPIWDVLVRVLPPLLWLRVPARAWIVVVVGLLLLAGQGLDALTEPIKRAALRRRLPLIGVLVLGVALPIAAIFLPLHGGAALSAAILVLTGVGLLLLQRSGVRAAWAVLILIDLLIVDVTLIEGRNQSDWLGRYEPLAKTLLDLNVARVYSPSYSLPQQAAAYWNIQTFGGVDPFQFAEYVTVVEEATGVRSSGYSVTLPALDGDPATVNRDARLNAALLAEWRVSHIVSAFPINDPNLQLITTVDGVLIYANKLYQAMPVRWQGNDIYTVSPLDGLVSSQQGWQLITVEADIAYLPNDQFIGLGLSAVALLSVVAIFGAAFIRGQRGHQA